MTADARQTFEGITRWLDAPGSSDPTRTNREMLDWEEGLEADLLRRECEALLTVPSQAPARLDRLP
jgi:hypothetical protein